MLLRWWAAASAIGENFARYTSVSAGAHPDIRYAELAPATGAADVQFLAVCCRRSSGSPGWLLSAGTLGLVAGALPRSLGRQRTAERLGVAHLSGVYGPLLLAAFMDVLSWCLH